MFTRKLLATTKLNQHHIFVDNVLLITHLSKLKHNRTLLDIALTAMGRGAGECRKSLREREISGSVVFRFCGQ